jgi:signal transduction histidine kinase
VDWQRLARTGFLVVVAVLVVTAQAQVWTSDVAVGRQAASAAVALSCTAPLLWARRAALPVLVVVVGAASAEHRLDIGLGQVWFALLLAVFALGRHAGTRAAAAGCLLVAVSVLAVDLPRLQDGDPLDEVLPGWFVVAGTWGLGRWLRSRQVEHQRLVEHAAAVERDRDEATRAAVAHERARIAAELHDLVAHSMAVIVLQAQAAGRVLGTDHSAVAGALDSIESVGRSGLAEMRRLLDVLLVDQADADLAGRPGMRRLDELVEQVRSAGLPIELDLEGQPTALPPGLDLSAYRIVQESLTNVLKHAGPVPVAVTIRHLPGALHLRVCNEQGRHALPRNGHVGHGLIGMRERVALFGGRLDAGPTPEGGYLVHAVLPTGAAS